MVRKMYPNKENGSIVDIDWQNQDFLFACCDCNSVHRLRFVVEGDVLKMQVWREGHRTVALRRHRGIPIRGEV
jgi:hypothetical protein